MNAKINVINKNISEKTINIAKAHAKEVKSNVKYLNTTTEELLNDQSHLRYNALAQFFFH